MKDNKPKVLKSEYLFQRPWLTVRREQLELKDGRIVPEYYVLEYPDWINVLAITKEGQFVFVRQYRHGIGETRYELCAGVRESDDPSPLAAAQRELLEETGYGNGNWQEWMVVSANPSTQNNLTYSFLATGVEKIADQELDDTEEISVHLLLPEEVRELLEQDQIKQALHAAPLWKYMAVQCHAEK